MSQRIGYCRTSTLDQDLERQRASLRETGCSRIFEEQASGKSMERPVLLECLDYLREGDTLVVHELDRLGRTMSGMLLCVEQLLDRGIHLKTLDGRLDTEAMDESLVKLLVGILGYAAETERKMLLKRTAEGREVARRNGVKLGRKRSYTDSQAAHVCHLREQGSGYGTIAKATGLTIATVRRIMANRAKC